MEAIVVAIFLQQGLLDEFTKLQQEAEKAALYSSMIAMKQDMINSLIMHEDENGRYFVYPYCFQADRETMINRMKLMEKDCPPYNDYKRLPPRIHANYNYYISRSFKNHLHAIYPYYGPAEQLIFDNWLIECEWRLAVWDLIADATGNPMDCWRLEGRRLLLQRLRKLIGVDAYNQGRWPDPLPDLAYKIDWDWKEEHYYE